MTTMDDIRYDLCFLDHRRFERVVDIKQRLSSRSFKAQLSAIKELEAALHHEESVSVHYPLREFLLEEDVVGFLCDAMATDSMPVLERTCGVLELLSDSDRMVRDGHTVLAVEAAQRCAHCLGLIVAASPRSPSADTLRIILGLISTLLSRWSVVYRASGRSVSSLCSPSGLLITLRTMLGLKSIAADTLFSVSRTMCDVLGIMARHARSETDDKLDNLVADCVHLCLNRLEQSLRDNNILVDEEHSDERGLALLNSAELICTVCSCVAAYRSELGDPPAVDEEDLLQGAPLIALEEEAVSKVVECCVPLVLSARQVSPEGPFKDEDGPAIIVPALLESLQTILDKGHSPIPLAHTLAKHQFLSLLPELQQASFGSSMAPLQLLSSILAYLAFDVLDANDWWEGDITGLAAHLTSAAVQLPAVCALWPSVLSAGTLPPPPLQKDAGPKGAAQHLLLLLLYFRCIAGAGDWDQHEFEEMSEHLTKLVMSLSIWPCTSTPSIVVKLVWLPLAECLLSADGDLLVDIHRASEHLVQLLRASGDEVTQAYTHHATLLYWAFQATGVHPHVQQRVAQLWLAHREDTSMLAEIVRVQRQAIFPLLDVVSAGAPGVAQAAARALLEARVEELPQALWHELPGALTRCSQDRADRECMAEACGLLLWLAAEVHEPPPVAGALRIAHLLAAVLGRRRLADQPRSLTAALRLATVVLRDTPRPSDPRVLVSLIGDERLLQAVAAAAESKDVQVCAAALSMLKQLQDSNTALRTSACPAAVPLPSSVLVSCLRCRDHEVREASLELLAGLLDRPSCPGSVVSIDLDTSSLRTIYWTLQNLAVSPPYSSRPTVWSALKSMLSRSDMLAPQPWNHTLLKYTMNKPLSELANHVLQFVLEWLRQVAPSTPPQPQPRRIAPSLTTQTAVCVAAALLKADTEFLGQPAAQDVARALLTVTADFPPEMFGKLKRLVGME